MIRPFAAPQPITTPFLGTFVSAMPDSTAGARRTCDIPRTNPTEQKLDPLAGGLLAAGVLGVNASPSAAEAGVGAA